jgi:hypothetical protein
LVLSPWLFIDVYSINNFPNTVLSQKSSFEKAGSILFADYASSEVEAVKHKILL